MTSSPDTGRPPTVLCIGVAVQDLIFQVDAFPAQGGKTQAKTLVVTTGGCAGNASITVARLGGRARFSGPLGGPAGQEPISDRIVAALAGEAVDTTGAVRVAGAVSAMSSIMLNAAGERTIVTSRDKQLDAVRCAAPEELLTGVDVVLSDNRFLDFSLPICEAARRRSLPVALDADKPTQVDDPLFAAASHVIFSAECLRLTTSCRDLGEALSRMSHETDGFLAVTDGPHEVLWLDAGVIQRMPAFPVTAVDTIAAGDVFHAAFAVALGEGRREPEALRFAAAAAAIKCTRFGGITGAPTRAETDAFLRDQT